MDKHVWIAPQNGSSVPIGAHILAKLDSRVKVKDDDLKEYWISEKDILGPMHITSILGVEDMTFLGELSERSILRNLLIRYANDLIYTYIGSVLVAVNPYKLLPIFDKRTMTKYRKKKLRELPPHIFAVADHSYESMKMSEKRCIIISGESGAGKTESTKLFLQYFAALSHKPSGKEKQILDSNPILEAFGNAKTVRNDNSSRFGKYISIIFNPDGSIHGAQIKQYLLEKSRVVYQNNGEQNYHIFYELLNGLSAEEKGRLKFKSISSYNYLNRSIVKTPSFNESTAFRQSCKIGVIKNAMKRLNFSDSEIWHIFELISVILHIGNIEFQTVSVSNVEKITSVTKEELQHVGALLQVPENNLMDSLTTKTISMHGDKVVKFLSRQEAINLRDAFVKKIFGNLFNYIVEKINSLLWSGSSRSNCYIGILDIFGFEAFDKNSLEQLCINYANERLQQFFIRHVFKTEQEEYAREGIKWEPVDYPDNTEIVELIEAGPQSILSIINDSTKIPRGSDQSMLEKLIEFNCENPSFLRPKYKTPAFGIQHFAGIVLYDIEDFVEKNYDSCSLDIKQVVRGSKNEFLKKVFASDFEEDSNDYYKKRMETLSSKFKNSLDLLMKELNECQPFFVRCIKPNEMKKPQKFDRMLCCKQLNYSGMTEVTKIRKAGYPVRYDFFQFVQRYRYLVPGLPLAHQVACKEATQSICRTVFKQFPLADYQMGRTKIFLKNTEELLLEGEREKVLYSYAVVIQKCVRRWLAQRRLSKLKKAVRLTEKYWLTRRQQIEGKKIRNSLYRLQAKVKSRLLTSEFHHYRQLISLFQAHCRGYLTRRSLKSKLKQSYGNNIKADTENSNKSIDFKEFAEKYFRDKQNHKFSKKPLKNSLTHLMQAEERLAAKALWLTILRYTGNISEPQSSNTKNIFGAQFREIFRMINKGSSSSQPDPETPGGIAKSQRMYEDWLKTRSTDVQKLCFIIGLGIRRAELRDEIYCQICKVITKNPSAKATRHGWDLLCSCTGCFPPSDLFLKYLKAFIRQGPTKYVSFCLFRLHRTIQNNCRTQPPFYTELEAIKRQKPVNLEVFLMNGTKTSVKIDSATTAKEMIDVVAKNIKLKDTFGFSLVLAQEVKHFSLGDGSTFVLDVISEYEQCNTEGGSFSEAGELKFYLKREMFAPWHDFTEDEVSNDLTYHQIRAGIMSGMYEFNEKNLPSLAAQICYVEKGKLRPSEIDESIDDFIATYVDYMSIGDLQQFKEEVKLAYQLMFGAGERSPNSVRANLIKYAATNLTEEFSRFFHISGSINNLKSAQTHPETPLLLGMNSKGIFITDEGNPKQGLARMDFADISEVSRREVTEGQGYILKLINYREIEISLTFQSTSDNDVHKLLIKVIETLKMYSKFAMAIKNFEVSDQSFMELQKGDLIALTDNFRGKDLLRNSWAKGLNKRTGETGSFLLNCVEIIPAVEEPSESTIKAMAEVVRSGKRIKFSQLPERLNHYTLESYADKHFKLNGKESNMRPGLWKYSKEKILRPLHADFVNKDKEAMLATQTFDAILQYMENYQSIENEEQIVCKIFSPGLENEELRNEIYCQIMKQLTLNPNKSCEIKAWELMYMITGLFSCGEVLVDEVKKFLLSRRSLLIPRECLARFEKVLNLESRKHPPHLLEIEAVKNHPCHLFHRIYFPDDSNKFFRVDSLMKFKDLKDTILATLKINFSKTGFCLLLQILGRLFLLPEDYYMFDYLQILKKWILKNKISKTEGEYKICFMKYTWIDSVPGHNKVIDLKFLFPQEYSYYIQGHYDIPQKELIVLAGLLYRINSFDQVAQPFQENIQGLIPPKFINTIETGSLKKEIQASTNKYHLLSKEDCKIMFLKQLKKFSYSAPHFTPIRQTSNLSNYMFYPTRNSRSVT